MSSKRDDLLPDDNYCDSVENCDEISIFVEEFSEIVINSVKPNTVAETSGVSKTEFIDTGEEANADNPVPRTSCFIHSDDISTENTLCNSLQGNLAQDSIAIGVEDFNFDSEYHERPLEADEVSGENAIASVPSDVGKHDDNDVSSICKQSAEHSTNTSPDELLHNTMTLPVETPVISELTTTPEGVLSPSDTFMTNFLSDNSKALFKTKNSILRKNDLFTTHKTLSEKTRILKCEKKNDIYHLKKNKKRLRREKAVQMKKNKIKTYEAIKKSNTIMDSTMECAVEENNLINVHNHDIMSLQSLYFQKIKQSRPPAPKKHIDDKFCDTKYVGDHKSKHIPIKYVVSKIQPTIKKNPKVQPAIHVVPKVKTTIDVVPKVKPTLHVVPKVKPTIHVVPKVKPTIHVVPEVQHTVQLIVPQAEPITEKKRKVGKKIHTIAVIEYKKRFAKYLSYDKVVKGLNAGILTEGSLKIDLLNCKNAYIITKDNVEIKIIGIKNRNRALEDDIVIVQQDQPLIDNVKSARVVYVKQKNHSREWEGNIEQVCAPLWRQIKYLSVLPGSKAVPILQIPLEDFPPTFLNEFKKYRKYKFVVKLLDWYALSFAVGALIKWISPEGQIFFPTQKTEMIIHYNINVKPISDLNCGSSNVFMKDNTSKHLSKVIMKEQRALKADETLTTVSSTNSSSSITGMKKKYKFKKYLSYEKVVKGLKKKKLIEGRLKVSPDSSKLAYIISFEDPSVQIHITEVADRNRALDDDIVIVKLKGKAKPGAALFGKVVYIKERQHPRKCIGKILGKNDTLWEQCQYITLLPLDKKMPDIQVPINEFPSSLTLQYEQFTRCLFLIELKDWYYTTFAVGTFLRCLGPQEKLSPSMLLEIEARLIQQNSSKTSPRIVNIVQRNDEPDMNQSNTVKLVTRNVLGNINPDITENVNSAYDCVQKNVRKLKRKRNRFLKGMSEKENFIIKNVSESDTSYDKLISFIKNGKMYEEYMPINDVMEGLADNSLVEGVLRINPYHTKHAYVTCNGSDTDIFIKNVENRNRALENDLVVVKLSKVAAPNERISGRVVFIKQRNHSQTCIGSIKYTSGILNYLKFVSFYPRDERMPIMQIPQTDLSNILSKGVINVEACLFLVQIVDCYSTEFTLGTILKCIGPQNDLKIQASAILFENELNTDPVQSDLITKFLPNLHSAISKEEIDAREDFRKSCVFTIDPETARDLDDAVSCKILENGNYQIGVHISDVTHYLKEGTDLDEAVSKKATTIYLIDNTFHMLPRELCVHCSLLPGKDRLTFSVIWEITKEGKIVNHYFTKSIINSCCQLSYEQVQSMLQNLTNCLETNDFPCILNSWNLDDIRNTVNILFKLSVIFKNKRFEMGALRIDQPKLSFKLHEETGLPVSYTTEEHNESHSLIEEFMLLANCTVATHISQYFPHLAFLRHHPPPKSSIVTVAEWFQQLNLDIDHSSAGNLMGYLSQFEDNEPVSLVLRTHLIKTMSRALYFCADGRDPIDAHHYSLNIPLYTHFTSPIRRYADVIVHRLLSSSLEYSPVPTWTPEYVQGIAEHCNRQKYKAKRAGDMSAELYLKKYISLNSPLRQKAVVTDINKKSIDVVLMSIGLTESIKFHDFSNDKVKIKSPKEMKGKTALELTAVWKKKGAKREVQVIKIFSILDVELTTSEDALTMSVKVIKPNVEN